MFARDKWSSLFPLNVFITSTQFDPFRIFDEINSTNFLGNNFPILFLFIFIYLLIYLLAYSLTCLLAYSLTRLLAYSLTRLLTYSFTGLQFKGRPLALPANIRQGWKVTMKTLAIKSFYYPGPYVIKLITAVICVCL